MHGYFKRLQIEGAISGLFFCGHPVLDYNKEKLPGSLSLSYGTTLRQWTRWKIVLYCPFFNFTGFPYILFPNQRFSDIRRQNSR